MEYREFSAKTVSDAITDACTTLAVTSDRLDYVVVEEGSNGFLGIGSKLATIKARIKSEEQEAPVEASKAAPIEEVSKDSAITQEEAPVETSKKSNVSGDVLGKAARKFLTDVFAAMDMKVTIETSYNDEEKTLDIDLAGDEMGVLIGKRGQTLDSVQYLVSLVVNRESEDYIHVKVDTENYRQRRKETLENLAKNIAFKVKRTRRSVSLEPMNPYERRIIHSALQNDKFVTTHSEGEEPFRHVVVTLKRQ